MTFHSSKSIILVVTVYLKELNIDILIDIYMEYTESKEILAFITTSIVSNHQVLWDDLVAKLSIPLYKHLERDYCNLMINRITSISPKRNIYIPWNLKVVI